MVYITYYGVILRTRYSRWLHSYNNRDSMPLIVGMFASRPGVVLKFAAETAASFYFKTILHKHNLLWRLYFYTTVQVKWLEIHHKFQWAPNVLAWMGSYAFVGRGRTSIIFAKSILGTDLVVCHGA